MVWESNSNRLLLSGTIQWYSVRLLQHNRQRTRPERFLQYGEDVLLKRLNNANVFQLFQTRDMNDQRVILIDD